MTSTATPVELWTRDLGSCLHGTLATVLLHDGHDPVTVLGAPWEFRRRPGAWTTEEYYFHAEPDSLAGRLALFHPFESTWHRSGGDPRDGTGDGLDELRDALAAGVLPIAAVDNYHLPFRPAFHDVHAAHLLVVYRITDTHVYVSDAQPPAFQGPIPIADFLNSWGSANPADDADVFFSSSPSDRRWLHARMDGPPPQAGLEWLAGVLRDNVTRYRQPSPPGTQTGVEGLRQYLAELCALEPGSAAAGEALSELYVISWNIQAQAGLHAEFLRAQSLRWRIPELAEAAARVDAVAHGWTGVRMTGAHSRVWGRHRFDELRAHGTELVRRLEVALEQLDLAADAVHRQIEEGHRGHH
ncbi:BtrH N-terminal domain-containing protein [Dactylosporangium aurantiacum]|uniref:BtrH N-terminal domain-containing protein n=1 Tax=Dactylosporangium aurantiacum TaxID=35754 RepID=A0A9Q9IR82_9ACTN|nr:BtrH N-terminal domain-containing protein [Dactylosporangium aurantiacum]MDG6103026.1 BtrH N-terminal domain-containing protein [Dactylosporangium aurantiacum]UWZ57538.1 BtrH N-terminal domain-containing protein [Dactylosporangium aurantiacum]